MIKMLERVDFDDFRQTESAPFQQKLPVLGRHFLRRLRTVPVAVRRFRPKRAPNRRSRHGQLLMADLYHYRRRPVQQAACEMVDCLRLYPVFRRYRRRIGRRRWIFRFRNDSQHTHQSDKLHHGAFGRAVLSGILHTDRTRQSTG